MLEKACCQADTTMIDPSIPGQDQPPPATPEKRIASSLSIPASNGPGDMESRAVGSSPAPVNTFSSQDTDDEDLDIDNNMDTMITTTQQLANKSLKRDTNEATTFTLCPQTKPRVAEHAQPVPVIKRPEPKIEEELPECVTLCEQTFLSRNAPALPADVIDRTQDPVVYPHIEDKELPNEATLPNNSNAGNPVDWYELVIQDTVAPNGDAQTETTVEGLKELLVKETIIGFGKVITELSKTVKLSKEAIRTLTETFQALASASTCNDINSASHLTRARKKTHRTKLSKYRTNDLDKKPGGVYVRPGSLATDEILPVTTTQNAPLQPSSVRIKSKNHRNSSPSQPKHRHKKTPNRARRRKPHPSYLAGGSGRSRLSSSAINNSQPGISTQNAPQQQRQSRSPPLQRQNVPHTSNNLNAVSQQPATTSHPKSPGREPPPRTRNNDRHTLSRDSYLYRTPHISKS